MDSLFDHIMLTHNPLSSSALSVLSRNAPSWHAIVENFAKSSAGQKLQSFLQTRQEEGAVTYPPEPLRCLACTPLDQVRVVSLGQDPYHGPGQAEGLAFSVPPGQRWPPSLRNILQEAWRETGSDAPVISKLDPFQGSLLGWANQGVLLWNSVLTVEQGQPSSHAGQGWEALTDAVLTALVKTATTNQRPLVFMLWGAHAQSYAPRLVGPSCLILQANHPSPLSAARPPRPFIGCGHFSQTNHFLETWGQAPIQWFKLSETG
jgi:uracil-DNA glycosylase